MKNKYKSDFKVYNNRENFIKKEKRDKKIKKETIKDKLSKIDELEKKKNVYKNYETHRFGNYYNGLFLVIENLRYRYRTTYIEKITGIDRIIKNENYYDIGEYEFLIYFEKDLKPEKYAEFLRRAESNKINAEYIVNEEYMKVINNYLLKRKLRSKLVVKGIIEKINKI